MALYRYVKRSPKTQFKVHPIVPFIFISIGILLLVWVSWPIMSFQILSSSLFARTITPLQDSIINSRTTLPISVLAADTNINKDKVLDYINVNSWYPGRPQKRVITPITTYRLSIPKLKIIDALVIIGGDSLDKSLVHYGGTALPGEYGNTVIFGHSTLPALYDPTNYKTIFTLLPTLKAMSDKYKGDEIYIKYDGVTYRYVIYDMVVVKPTDLSALEQKYDASYLTLITCVPPGTYWERLNVKAKLLPFP